MFSFVSSHVTLPCCRFSCTSTQTSCYQKNDNDNYCDDGKNHDDDDDEDDDDDDDDVDDGVDVDNDNDVDVDVPVASETEVFAVEPIQVPGGIESKRDESPAPSFRGSAMWMFYVGALR